MKTFRTLALLAVPLLIAAAAVGRGGHDYSTIPPAPAEVLAALSAKQPLTAAITAAQEATGGRAREASFGADGDVTVHTYSATEHVKVVVDGASGAVKSKQSASRFPGAPVRGEWTETSSGLKYYDLVVGTGETPAGPSTRVKVHYSGWLNDGTPFDSSVERGQPAVFGLSQVIAGWTEGVGSMKVGGKRKLIIPYPLAYKEAGRPPVIPPKALLVFDIELLEIVK
jgi:peptidylprolyl isomerase